MKEFVKVFLVALAACVAPSGACASAQAGAAVERKTTDETPRVGAGAPARPSPETSTSKSGAATSVGASRQDDAANGTTGRNDSFAKPGAKTGDAASQPGDATRASSDVDPTTIYRVGVGDVLDIRLLDAPRSRRSTLFSVQEGGLLDYPLAGRPRVVAGLTTDEIAARLAGSFRLRSLFPRPPRLLVSVREYASHTVTVEGLVSEPGTKIIRREAVPLYVVVADAQPRREAGVALLRCRLDGRETAIDLSDLTLMKTPVHAGDAVAVEAARARFYDIEGLVARPGRKEFHTGLTLTQAVMQAGGVTERRSLSAKQLEQLASSYNLPPAARSSYLVVVARRGADDTTRQASYNLKEIEEGRAPDPPLRPGDRVLVIR